MEKTCFNQDYCEFCGKDSKGIFYGRGYSYKVLECRECGLLWCDPLCNDDYLKSVDGSYNAEDVYLEQEKYQKKRFRDQLKKVLEYTEKERRKLKILDIGSGLGFFLDVCEEAGIDCTGCDINRNAVNFCNRNRVRAFQGTIEDNFEVNTFDIIFAFNLIEHLHHPEKFIRRCAELLKSGGLLVLETPLRESLFHYAARVGDLLTGYRLNYYGLSTNGHIYKFSRRTFGKFSFAGFRQLYSGSVGSPFGEISGKLKMLTTVNRVILSIALPVFWLAARITGLNNRIFCIMKVSK